MIKTQSYEAPSVVIYTMTVEQGFAVTLGGSTTDYTEGNEDVADN